MKNLLIECHTEAIFQIWFWGIIVTKYSMRSSLADDKKLKELKILMKQQKVLKGLTDSGVAKIPKIFFCPLEETQNSDNKSWRVDWEWPKNWDCQWNSFCFGKLGFFQLVGHGVPVKVMEKLLESINQFHEQPPQMKMEFYSRDPVWKVRYYSTGDFSYQNYLMERHILLQFWGWCFCGLRKFTFSMQVLCSITNWPSIVLYIKLVHYTV